MLSPIVPEFRLKESTLYLLYADRKHLPFKARTLIDLVLESTVRKNELTQTTLAANRRRFVPQEHEPALAGSESKHPGCS